MLALLKMYVELLDIIIINFEPTSFESYIHIQKRRSAAKADQLLFPSCLDSMSLVVRKLVVGVFDQVRHKPGCTATEDG